MPNNMETLGLGATSRSWTGKSCRLIPPCSWARAASRECRSSSVTTPRRVSSSRETCPRRLRTISRSSARSSLQTRGRGADTVSRRDRCRSRRRGAVVVRRVTIRCARGPRGARGCQGHRCLHVSVFPCRAVQPRGLGRCRAYVRSRVGLRQHEWGRIAIRRDRSHRVRHDGSRVGAVREDRESKRWRVASMASVPLT